MKTWKHILLLCPDEKDATSFYRAWGPFGELASQSEHPVFLSRAAQIAWSTIGDKDLVVLQRPCLPTHVEVLDIARRNGTRTWVDWDDLLWQIPDGNPVKQAYGNPKTLQKHVMKCAELANIITVSTSFLKDMFPKTMQEKISVLRNRLPRRWRHQTPHTKTDTPIHVAWRGSRTHDADWIDYLDQVLVFCEKIRTEWHLIGTPPISVSERLSSVAPVYLHHEIPMERYFEWLIKEGPQADILFVPLRDNAFNRSKSNIAMLEATFGGMLCVGPKWDEWITGISDADRLLYVDQHHISKCLLLACEQAQRGAFTLVKTLQEHFLTQFDQGDIDFQNLVWTENVV